MGVAPRWSPRSWQLVGDATLAAACVALSATVLLSPSVRPQLGVGAWLLAFLHAAPLAARRVAPRASFVVSLSAAAAYLLAGFPMVGLALTGLALVYSVAAYTSFRESLVALVATELALLGSLSVSDQLPDTGTTVGNVLGLATAWLLGDATRRRSELAARYRERAEELEAAQAELAHRAVVEERLRIARELHDVVAHSMSVVAVQAGTARMILGDEAPEAGEAMRAIEASSRSALNEMRRLLGVLRDPREAPVVAPLPTLADLDHLLADAAEGGTPVDVRIEGRRRRLAPGIELAAYRIIQEALTNVRRHAPGATAVVRVAFTERELVIDIENDMGDDGAGRGGGLGLKGMRERASVYGGTVEAGPRDGKFRVLARLPCGEPER